MTQSSMGILLIICEITVFSVSKSDGAYLLKPHSTTLRFTSYFSSSWNIHLLESFPVFFL